ncbi:MAG: bifunctional methylenetetrahydrofolate dehydrogenase/methenyltetrahydrofolate cyclohydrolase FolD [Oligoflexia bacterium]|nr:bifunctional methylenetetrahydrofolate dehydrogenase/methenyltetrahydrofolate cyclohydrolase FolD [Oligoflexia bacterium]
MAQILDGKKLAEQVLDAVKAEVALSLKNKGRAPGLGVVLVGENPASKAYVANKERSAKRAGFHTYNLELPADCSAEKLTNAIQTLNSSDDVDGILVQLPLPSHLDPENFIALISPEKDADGLHPFNQGRLMRGLPGIRPCTPLGCMKLIDLALLSAADFESGKTADLSKKRALVVGRSTLVGKPIGLMLLERNATVTTAHSRSADLKKLCMEADILIAAVGQPEMIRGEWVKPGAVVIDVGINRVTIGPKTGKLVGDVAFAEASERAAAITPVPGGVGPMTVAMLIQNTLQACKLRARARLK